MEPVLYPSNIDNVEAMITILAEIVSHTKFLGERKQIGSYQATERSDLAFFRKDLTHFFHVFLALNCK